MKTNINFFRFLILTALFVSSSIAAFSQIESSTLKDFDHLHRNNFFIEDFDNQEILFNTPKLIGPSGDMMINSGEMKLSHKEKGDGLMFIAKTTPGSLDKVALEFEIRFKMISKDRPIRIILELGQKKRGQAPLKIDMNEDRVVCLHNTDFGEVVIKEKLNEIYKKDDYNKVTLIRLDNRIMLFINNTMVGQSKYSSKKEYAFDPKTVLDERHDLRIRFIHPNGSVDYVKIAELTNKPVRDVAQVVEKKPTAPVSPPVAKKDPPAKIKKQEDSSRDSGFDFSKSVSTEDAKKAQQEADLAVQGKYYAIIIGNNEYQDASISTLDQPIKDAQKLYNVLTTEYTFEKKDVLFLKNATRTNIIEAFDALSNNLTSSDNLLIFYAGHGYWNEKKETGYWLPVDAKKSNTANWLRNSTIQGYLDEIPAKHTLLIADACFGGGIFKTRKAFSDAPPSIESLYKLKSRKGITSGMLNEVPDKSVFMEYLTKRLTENDLKYVSTLDIFTQFRVAVMNNSNNTPQYGTIHNTGDEGGDFIFIKKIK